MFLAGDLFHTRGEIKPSVLNPTMSTFRDMEALYPGVTTYAIPGNHDLETKDTTYLGNAMQALADVRGFTPCLEPTVVGDVVVFPWYPKLDDLREAMLQYADPGRDAIIHAPVNGVLIGIPDHGLDAAELAAMGYRRVFSGHYHNHAVMADGKVISVGATTHQTWSDVGTKAGFLLVYEDRIEWVESKAPKFVDIDVTKIESEEDLATQVKGNFARLRLEDAPDKDVLAWKADIAAAGALGQLVLNPKKPKGASRSSQVKASASLSIGASVEAYVKNHLNTPFANEVSKLAQEILSEVA